MAWYDKFAPVPPPKPQDLSWLDKFSPKTPPPQDPQTAPVIIQKGSTQQSHNMQVEDVILQYNNTLSMFQTASVYTNVEEGVTIHKITPEQAARFSTRIKPSAYAQQMPLTIALACLAIESTFDEACSNANIGVTSTGVPRSNPTGAPEGFDLGGCQFKIKYLIFKKPFMVNGVLQKNPDGSAILIPGIPGVVDIPTAQAFALDIDRAIPYFCSLMADKYLWAQNVIQQNTSSAPDVRLSNPWLLATGAFNFGEAGMLVYYENGTFPSHCTHVYDLETFFSKELGVESEFASLPKPTA